MSTRVYKFFDSVVNCCDHCGVRSQIAPVFRPDGRLYFLCRAGVVLVDEDDDVMLDRELAARGVAIVCRDEPEHG